MKRSVVGIVRGFDGGFAASALRCSAAYNGGRLPWGMPTKFVTPLNVVNQSYLKSEQSVDVKSLIPASSFSSRIPTHKVEPYDYAGVARKFLTASFAEPELVAPKVTEKPGSDVIRQNIIEQHLTRKQQPLRFKHDSIPRPLPILQLGKTPTFIPPLTPVGSMAWLLDAVQPPIPSANVNAHKKHVPMPSLDPTTTALISANRFNKPLPVVKKTSHTIQDTTQVMPSAILRVSSESLADLLPLLSMQNVSHIAVFHPRDLMDLTAAPLMMATIDRVNNTLQLQELDRGVPTLTNLSLVSSAPEQRLVPKPIHAVTSMPLTLKLTAAAPDELAVLIAWRFAKAALNDPKEAASLTQIKQTFEAVCIQCKRFQMPGGMGLNHDQLYGFLANAEVAAYKAALKEPDAERQRLFIQCVADCQLLERVKTEGQPKVVQNSPGLAAWLHKDLQTREPLAHLGSVSSAKMAVVTGDRVALTLNCQRGQRQTGTVVLTTTPGNETLHLHVSTRLSHFGSGDRTTQKALARQELAFMIAEGAYALKKAAHPEKTPAELAKLIAQTPFKVDLADQALAVLLAEALKAVGIRAEAKAEKASKPPLDTVTSAQTATTLLPERPIRDNERALAKGLAALYKSVATNVA